MTTMTMPRARRSDPFTSHEAADSVRNVTDTHTAILTVLANGAKSDEEIFLALASAGTLVSVSGARTRRAELVEMGRVVDSGQLRLTRSNRRTKVWALA